MCRQAEELQFVVKCITSKSRALTNITETAAFDAVCWSAACVPADLLSHFLQGRAK